MNDKEDAADAACPWCEHNPYGCTEDERCDFKSLPYEEQEIVDRINDEVSGINEHKQRIASGDVSDEEARELFTDISDVAKGIQIMVDRLKADFGYTDEKVKKQCGFEDASTGFVTKAKLAASLARMKLRRKKKR